MPSVANRRIEGQRVVLSAEDTGWFLGPNLIFSGCQLEIRIGSASLVLVPPVELHRSSVCSTRVLKNYRFHRAAFRECSFSGKYHGCDFGPWPEHYPAPGVVFEDVDLSSAALDLCRIFNADLQRIRFGSWPSFAILDPRANSDRIKSLRWPGQSTDRFCRIAADQPPGVVALVQHAPAFLKSNGGDEESLRDVLSRLDFVRMGP